MEDVALSSVDHEGNELYQSQKDSSHRSSNKTSNSHWNKFKHYCTKCELGNPEEWCIYHFTKSLIGKFAKFIATTANGGQPLAHPEQYLTGVRYYLERKSEPNEHLLPFTTSKEWWTKTRSGCCRDQSHAMQDLGGTKQQPFVNKSKRNIICKGLHDKGHYLEWARLKQS